MKFWINTDQLKDSIDFVKSVCEAKATIPVLSHIHLEALDEETLEIKGSDLDNTLITKVAANITNGGEPLCVSGKKLADILNLLPEAPIFFETAPNDWLKIKCNKSQYKLKCISAAHFAESPRRASYPFKLNSSLLENFIKHIESAISNEQSRYTLSGARFEISGKLMRMVSTDGHRLSLIESELKPELEHYPVDALIPKKGITELLKLCKNNNGHIGFNEDKNHLYFQDSRRQREIITRRLSGTFPNYDSIIPKNNDLLITFSTHECLTALARVRQMCDPRTDAIKMFVRGDQIKLVAEDTTEGYAEDYIKAEYSGSDEVKLKFQSRYLFEFLNSSFSAGFEKVSIAVRDERTQSLFRPENQNGNRRFTIIMPLKF